MAYRVVSVVVVVLLGCSCATERGLSGFECAPLFGMAHDLEGEPVGGVSVSLDGSPVAVSDNGGRFIIPDVARGGHDLHVSKPGYESVDSRIDFQGRTQVLYVRLVSRSRLLRRAEGAIEGGEWSKADGLLRRAASITGPEETINFLKAVVSFRRGNYRAAKERLLTALATGDRAPSLFLFLADLYQHHLDRVDLAANALREFLKEEESAEVRNRLEALEQTGPRVP